MDLDHFKRVNDQHVHPAGDALLQGVVQRLQQAIREADLLGRYGGEDIMLVLPWLSMHDSGGAARVQALCQAAGTGPHLQHGRSHPRRRAVGRRPRGMALLETLIASADAALYQAKLGGRNRVVASD